MDGPTHPERVDRGAPLAIRSRHVDPRTLSSAMVSVLSAVRDIGRLRQIYVVLVRHGFADLAQRLGFRGGKGPDSRAPDSRAPDSRAPDSGEGPRSEGPRVSDADRKRGQEERRKISTAERVRLVLMDLGPSFVKLGQIASTRPDVLPEEWVTELKKLQDEVKPLDFDEIRDAVEAPLGAPLDEIYDSFDEEPLAAASIAQVHRAVLKTDDGTQDVVVKVQRPNIANTIARDVEILHILAAFIERTIPESHIYQPSLLVDQFDSAITAELDFALEADNAKRFAQNFEGHPHALFPKVFKTASSKRVLTLEFLDGHKIYEAISDHGHEGPRI
ncbi:MAG: ABC1 kinase family protein, partial [Planctomycetota bacterium]